MLLAAWSVFWCLGHAEGGVSAAPTRLALEAVPPFEADELPGSDAGDAVAPCLPEVGEQSREAKRYDRLGKKRDGQITRT